MKKIVLLLTISFLIAEFVYAQPQHSFIMGATTGNTIPFSSAASNKRQWVYYPTDFPTSPAGFITTIYFLASGTPSPNFNGGLLIRMGNTNLNTFVAGPFIDTNMDTVFYANTFSTTALTGGWIQVNLQTPFYFDGISNFIVEAAQFGYTTGFTVLQATLTARSLFGSATATSVGTQDRLAGFGFDLLPVADDAGITSIDSPNIPSCTTPDVWVKLINEGSTPLTSTTINWSVNGATQNPLAWTGNVSTFGGVSTPVWIGTFNFSGGDVLRVWTSDPNGQPDGYDANDTLVFTIPVHQSASLPSQSVVCNAGSITLNPQISNGTFLWSTGETDPSITVLDTGLYTLTFTDVSGCVTTASSSVVRSLPVQLPDSVRFCEGGAATIETNMQGTYFWSTGQTSSVIQVNQSGLYSVTVTDLFGCISDASTQVVEVLLPIADFSTFLLTYGVRVTNLSQNATGYLWDFGDGRTSNAENLDHIYPWPGGTFTITLKAFNECDTSTTTVEVTVNGEVSTNAISANEGLNVYPNPNNGQFNLEINAQQASQFSYTITDISGKQITSKNVGIVNGRHVETIEINNVSSGFYFVKVKSNTKESVIKISVQ